MKRTFFHILFLPKNVCFAVKTLFAVMETSVVGGFRTFVWMVVGSKMKFCMRTRILLAGIYRLA
jgi:hypothetical protein